MKEQIEEAVNYAAGSNNIENLTLTKEEIEKLKETLEKNEDIKELIKEKENKNDRNR